MPMLIGLEGVKGKIETECASSVSKMIQIFRNYGAATAAGDDGAICIWRDDRGILRGDLQRYMITMDKQEFATIKAMHEWVRTTWPKIGRDAIPVKW